MPRPLIPIASTVLLLATGLSSHGWAGTKSVPVQGTLNWVISLDAARTAADEKVDTPEELTARFERLIALFDGCVSCRQEYYGALAYRLDHEFRDRAAVLHALAAQYADRPVELSRIYLEFGRPEDAARVAVRGLETVSFLEQRAELHKNLAQARKEITDLSKSGLSTSSSTTGATNDDRIAKAEALRTKLNALVAAKETDAASEVALELIARFPDSISACQACEGELAMAARRPDVPQAIEHWIRDCRSIAARCPERSEMFNRMLPLVPSRDRKASIELLLASELPEDVTPLLLLYLADAIRPADSERALEVDRRAIANPQYPGMRGYWGSMSPERFERHGDIRSALFLELFRPIPDPRCSGDECSLMRTHAFRVAYYKLLLGMEPEQQWARIIEIVPASPQTAGAEVFHTPEYLDRLVGASRSVHQEAAAAIWLRGLEGRYAELIERPGGQSASVYMRSLNARRTLRELQLTVAGYIDEIESPSAECEIRNDPTIDPIGSVRPPDLPAAEDRGGPIDSRPRPGSIEWAIALAAARDVTRATPANAKELVESYEPLMALNRDCTMCRQYIRDRLEYLLKNNFNDSAEIDRIDEKFADTLRELSRVLLRTGRFKDAHALALREEKKAEFVEDRLAWVEILAEASARLGKTREAERLVGRLREETPVSAEYCTKASQWHAWLHGPTVPPVKLTTGDELVQAVQEMRSLQKTEGSNPDDRCLMSQLLVSAGSFASQVKSMDGVGLTEFRALFPEGAQAAQFDLARKTRAPKVRAAILLSAAHTWRGTLGRSESLALIREAKGAGPEPEIQVGALREELSVLYPLSPPEEREQVRALARTVISRFPTYDVSCVACEQDWYATTSLPDASREIPRWWTTCETFMDHCPNGIERWTRMAPSFGARPERIGGHPPPEAIPPFLLSRSDAVRSSNPQQALQLERDAVRHPQYPGLGDTYGSERQMRAEAAGDFETALYLELLRVPPEGGGCIPGDRSTQILPQFRSAYYKVRLGIEPTQQWKALVEMLPTSPGDPTSRSLHTTEHFERIAKAASAAREESAAINWFRLVRRNYATLSAQSTAGDEVAPYTERDPREIELILGGHIAELHASLCGPGPRLPIQGQK